MAHMTPTLASCLNDPHALLEVYDLIDMPFSIDIVLSRTWNLIWAARQLNSVQKQHSSRAVSTISLISSHWEQELNQTLRNFRMIVSDVEPLSPATMIVHEHLLLNIHVSFEELSLFAGKEGAQDARRVLPLLRQWADSRDSRQAVWHAGQILREATTLAADTLRDFYAIALYHAGLTLWAYGILVNESSQPDAQRPRSFSSSGARAATSLSQEVVFLDGHETADTQKFISLARATPAIRKRSAVFKQPEGTDSRDVISLDDPRSVMDTVTNVLHQNHGATSGKTVPPLVENLTHLMQDLGRAATKFSRRR